MNRCEVRDYGYGTGPFEWLGISKIQLTGEKYKGEVELSFEVRVDSNNTKYTRYVVSIYIGNCCAMLTDGYDNLDDAEYAYKRRVEFVRNIVRPTKEIEGFEEAA